MGLMYVYCLVLGVDVLFAFVVLSEGGISL